MKRSIAWSVSINCWVTNLPSSIISPLSLHIAWRYLFSRKGHNAINIVTAISAAAVGVVTAAMVCVMSVMNGFGSLVESMFSEFDPDLKIVSASSGAFSNPLPAMPEWNDLTCAEVVEGQALVEYKDHRTPCLLMGMGDNFQAISHIDSVIVDGTYSVFDGAFERAVLGRGLAAELGMNAHFVGGIHIYVPKRKARVNMLRPDESFHRATAFIAGEFAINQVDYDNQRMLISLPLARQLFDYDSTTVTALYVQVPEERSLQSVKSQLRQSLGSDYRVLDRYEQQEDFYHILRIEKLLTALLMVFILLIASFNIVGSLSMLIIDKREDIRILSHLGMSETQIRRVFLWEGWLVSSLGAMVGLVVGLLICLVQEHFGLLKLGTGTEYVISAYPVRVVFMDICIVWLSVLLIGAVAAWLPARRVRVMPIGLLILLLAFVGCKPKHEPSPSLRLATELDKCYITDYGTCYPDCPQRVLMLDIYGGGLSLDASYKMQGTGTNICLSDVFLPVDSLSLPSGVYRTDTTAAAYTLLPGKMYDDNPCGVYTLLVWERKVQSIAVYPDSQLEVSYVGDSLDLVFKSGKYQAHYRGIPEYL